MAERRNVVVVGAGVHGLCTAFFLYRLGARDVLVLDAEPDGHVAGSSHGHTRITRTSYGDERWIRLAMQAHRDGWPLLEAALGVPLLLPTPGLFFGPSAGPFGAFLRATEAAGAPVERLASAAARDRFPALRIGDGEVCLLDHSAAVVAAARAMTGLRAWCDAVGIERRAPSKVEALRHGGEGVVLESGGTTLRAERVVLAAGAGLVELLPEFASELRVLKQDVGYFVPATAPPFDVRPGAFPVWARIGEAANDFVYGLPEFGRAGLKLARHRTCGAGDDVAARRRPADRAALMALAEAHLAVPVELAGAETCTYTMAPDDDLRVVRYPGADGLVVVAACSGHAFKFAPELGRLAAELALSR